MEELLGYLSTEARMGKTERKARVTGAESRAIKRLNTDPFSGISLIIIHQIDYYIKKFGKI